MVANKNRFGHAPLDYPDNPDGITMWALLHPYSVVGDITRVSLDLSCFLSYFWSRSWVRVLNTGVSQKKMSTQSGAKFFLCIRTSVRGTQKPTGWVFDSAFPGVSGGFRGFLGVSGGLSLGDYLFVPVYLKKSLLLYGWAYFFDMCGIAIWKWCKDKLKPKRLRSDVLSSQPSKLRWSG